MSLNNVEIQSKLEKYIARTQQIPYSPIAFFKGEGAILYDHEGKRYIDFLSSASSSNLGHGNKEIAKCVYEQMQNLTQYTLAYFNTQPPVLLAKKICELVPGNFEKKVLFSTTGSASIDAAIKLSRAYTNRSKVISMIGSYHGSTFGAISASALNLNMRKKIGPLLAEFYHFKYPNEDYSWQKCINDIEIAFDMYLDPYEVACIIIEPISGDLGIVIPPKEWIIALRKICDKYGILLVCDEIQMGLCRTGKWFAIENFDIEADLYVMGKSLGGGLPLGAVVGKKEIMDSLDAPAHLFTMAANATCCVAGLKTIEILERINANKISVEKGNYIKTKFNELKKNYNFIGDIRCCGLNLGVDIINPKDGSKDHKAVSKISYECFRRGLILIFLGKGTLRIQPPLTIEYSELDEAMTILENVMKDFSSGKISDEILSKIKGW